MELDPGITPHDGPNNPNQMAIQALPLPPTLIKSSSQTFKPLMQEENVKTDPESIDNPMFTN